MVLARVEVYNSYCYLNSESTTVGFLRALDMETAYLVDGHQHVESFKKGYWDGREHLLVKSRKTPRYYFPTGILPMLLKSGFAPDMELVDCRKALGQKREFHWEGEEPRGYQERAEAAAILERGPEGIVTGRGLLNLPIRSGKTTVAAMIQKRLGYRSLFIVGSDLLLHQTVESFRSNLGEDLPIGKCGGGIWDPKFITVATIQTILARYDAYQTDLKGKYDILYQDEAHHLEGPQWRAPVVESDARFKFGLSATIFANRDIEAERGAIWLQAATGPILYRVSMQYLFNHGYLIRPHVLVYDIPEPLRSKSMFYREAYPKCIEANEFRNSAIADIAEQACLDHKLRVLIDTGRIKQMMRIKEMLGARGVRVAEIYGKTPSHKRRELIADFASNEIQCLVGTVLGEGVDIPELEMVINAEGQKSKEAVIQRMRNLTPPKTGAAAKTEVLFVDFNDVMNDKLAEHSAQRLAMYKGTRGIEVTEGLRHDSSGHFHLPPKSAA